MLGNAAMIIAGDGRRRLHSADQLMAKAMNRRWPTCCSRVLARLKAGKPLPRRVGVMKPIDIEDAAIQLAYAQKVVIVPGYGMAVAQAQHKIWSLAQLLEQRGVDVKFAIHPVAGRMPGHMNVLLAEAGVPYEVIVDMEDINEDFPNTDESVVVGANDVVNPGARTDTSSPIYGMPILDVDKSHNVLIVKRGRVPDLREWRTCCSEPTTPVCSWGRAGCGQCWWRRSRGCRGRPWRDILI